MKTEKEIIGELEYKLEVAEIDKRLNSYKGFVLGILVAILIYCIIFLIVGV